MLKTDLSSLASKIPVWPEWNDNDISSEKWLQDAISLTPSEKKLAPSISAFEDRDGRDWFPQTYGFIRWKRPADYLNTKYLCVNDPNTDIDFDMISLNKHLSSNELMRSIIGQIISLVNLSVRKNYMPEAVGVSYVPPENTPWRPWHHVYSLCKAGKIPHNPQYNPWGKYAVRLYWMGCWRKIFVDDFIPLTKEGKALLPFTHNGFELWPALLTKGLLKIASLETAINDERDFSAIEHLTEWIPERIILYRRYLPQTWDVIMSCFAKEESLSQISVGPEKRKVSKKSPRVVNALDGDFEFPCMAVFADVCDYSYQESSLVLKKMKTILHTVNFTPELKHSIYIPEYRTRPLQPPKLPEDTPKWKLIRRHIWDENYISKEDLEKPIKVLGLFLPWAITEAGYASEDSMIASAGSQFLLRPRKVKDPNKYAEAIPVQWITYEDFCKCFNKICVYHKPSAYTYCFKLYDIKTTAKKQSTTKLVTISAPQSVFAFSDGVPFYLFSDNLATTEILMAISIAGAMTEISSRKPGPNDSVINIFTSGATDNIGPTGCILVESFDCQRQVSTQIILTIKTAASKGSMLVLPPGRHVLSITIRSNFGCVVSICTNSAIALGDEEVIFPKISSESLRFQEHSKDVLTYLIDSFFSFSNQNEFRESQKTLIEVVCPTREEVPVLKGTNNKYLLHFNTAVCSLITRVSDTTPVDLKFALRAFTLLPYEIDLFSESKIKNRKRRLSSVFSLYDELPSLPSSLDLNVRPQTPVENDITVIQSCIRRLLVQNLLKARSEGKYNLRAADQLTKLIPILEKNRPDAGYFLLRNYFHLTPKVIENFSFWKDERNSVLKHDYYGSFPGPIPTKTWLVVYRDVFYVTDKSVKITPCVQCDSVTWTRHVVNNDTLQEVSDSIAKMSQSTYLRNKFGYTILIRIFTTAVRYNDVKWSLRMISPIGSMYLPMYRDPPSLTVREIFDYYCPHKNQVITKYAVYSLVEGIVSIQFMVSSPQVKLQINIYEETKKILSVRDKGHVIVPAIYLHKPNTPDPTTLTYYVQAKVLNESWAVAEYNIPLIQVLQFKEKMELHLGLASTATSEPTKSTLQADSMFPRVSKKKYLDSRGESTGSKQQIDSMRPHWSMRIIVDTSTADSLHVQRDTRRIEEICSIKRKWESDCPGRFNSAAEVRAKFIQTYSNSYHSLTTTSTGRVLADGSTMSTMSDASEYDRRGSEIALLKNSISDETAVESPVSTRYVIPQPLQTKVDLKPWDISQFVRKLKPDRPVLKDQSVASFQVLVHNRVCANFALWKNELESKIEHEKAKQLSEKHLLLDQCEQWQTMLEEKRTHFQSQRELYREKVMELEVEAARLAHYADDGKYSPASKNGDKKNARRKI